jgi:sigma-B regulation protein RsbU (phosphoserine phosphatase)
VRILVVDDDEAIRILLASRLRTLGHEIDTASDGSEAWGKLTSQRSDLLVCDWNMPVMTGLELCRKIRESDWPSYVYVILCTSMNQKADFLAGMEAGADDFIVKPVDFADLRVRIRAAERMLELQRELSSQNQNLREVYGKLRGAYDTIERDLQVAAAMQLELLPKKAELNRRVNLDWLFIPSLFLAGDMLNYFMFDEERLVLYHLDVAGHGIPAALLSVMLNRLLLPFPGSPIAAIDSGGKLGHLLPPDQVVAGLNRRFQSTTDSYFTMIYGIFETSSRKLTFCQAGHPGPVLLSPGGKLRRLGSGGFPVGMMPDMEYEQQSTRLKRGDRIIFYSDGIPECLNPNGSRYSEQNLFNILRGCGPYPLSQMLDSVRDDVARWRGDAELSDDLSLLAMECL